MPSSTSNSNISHRRWVAQLLIAFVFFVSLANWGVHYLRDRFWWATRDLQMPGIQNQVIVERYAYDWSEKNIVIVGSSVTTLLPPDGYRPSNVATLFVQGSGGMSGLEVLMRSGASPKLVLIEVDFLTREIQHSLIHAIFKSPLRWFKRYLPCLRYENNLANLLFKSRLTPLHDNDSPNETSEAWNAKLRPRIDYYLNEHSKYELLTENELKEMVSRLKDRVCLLEERGCKIAFFIDPIHPDVAASPHFKNWYARIYQEFSNYPIIEPQTDHYYYLVDGIHFFAQSGKEYFDHLMQEADKLLTSN